MLASYIILGLIMHCAGNPQRWQSVVKAYSLVSQNHDAVHLHIRQACKDHLELDTHTQTRHCEAQSQSPH